MGSWWRYCVLALVAGCVIAVPAIVKTLNAGIDPGFVANLGAVATLVFSVGFAVERLLAAVAANREREKLLGALERADFDKVMATPGTLATMEELNRLIEEGLKETERRAAPLERSSPLVQPRTGR